MSDTLQKKKTNFDYLRELLTRHIAPVKKDEAMEFLEAIENDFTDVKDELKQKGNELDNKQTEVQELEKDKEYSDRIETNLGPQGIIRFQVDNISCQSMMEELEAAISRGVPIVKIENVLRAL